MRANERIARENSIAFRQQDRSLFVHNLGVLLSQTDNSIRECYLESDLVEVIVIVYNNGDTRRSLYLEEVSYTQMIQAVLNKVLCVNRETKHE